jgi:hypothetical protein
MMSGPDQLDIQWYEVFLWIWLLASLIEEGVQYSEDRSKWREWEREVEGKSGLYFFYPLHLIKHFILKN